MKPTRLIFGLVILTIIPTGTVFPDSGLLDSDGGHFDRDEGTYHHHRPKTISRDSSPPIDIESVPNKVVLKLDGCYKVKAEKQKSLRMFTSYTATSQQIELRKTTTIQVIKDATLLKERWYGILYMDNKESKAFVREEDWHKFEGKASTLPKEDCNCLFVPAERLLITAD